MPHDRVRTNHDELSQIARLFGQEAAAVQKTLQALRQAKDTLQGGDWIGQAARTFYAEMDSDVLPTLLRLERALSQAQQTTGRIGARLRQCEAEAAHQLQDREAFTGQPVGGSGGSLPPTDGGYSIEGGIDLGPYSASGALDALHGSVSDTGSFGQTAEGHVAGSQAAIGFDPFGLEVAQVTGEGVLLGGEAGYGWGGDLKGAAVSATGGSYEVELAAFGGWGTQGVEFDVFSGNVFVGQQDGNFGLGGSLSSASAATGIVLGGENFGITFGGDVGGPSADIQLGLMNGSGAAGGGARLAGVNVNAGLNVLGWNVGIGGGAELGGSFGFQLGEKTQIKIGPFSGSLMIGDAK